MSKLVNLSATEAAKVTSTLEHLASRTGKDWRFEVMQGQGSDESPLLEISVDGRIARPIKLSESSEDPAACICRELENHALSLTRNTAN